jgi:molecular chaperone GrpE
MMTEELVTAGAESAPAAAETAEFFKGHLQRLQAEFDNYRKRVAKEKQVWNAQARGSVIEKLLPVLDNFGYALMIPALTDDVKVGLEMIRKQFLDLLADEGVSEVTGTGTVFDPRWHEALETKADAAAAGTILAVRRAGWRMGDRVLRAAQVVVSSGPAAESGA